MTPQDESRYLALVALTHTDLARFIARRVTDRNDTGDVLNEAAVLLGVSASTARTRHSRAIARLRAQLAAPVLIDADYGGVQS